MRFSRDKRGYENTFVVQGERRKGRGRSRVLYWFRTPPGVKVGRAALDEEAIRLIEELNPEIEFDWTRILKGDAGDTAPERQRSGEARRTHDRRAQDRPRPPVQRVRRPGPVAIDARPAEPAPVMPVEPDEPAPREEAVPPSPAHARLGSEGVSRLRGRYAEIMARISERITDEARRDELKSAAERLNPDNWVTGDEVSSGLEQYEEVFASLRAAVGGRKRRRRRRSRSGPGSPALGGAQSADSREADVYNAETPYDEEHRERSDPDSDDGL